MSFGYHSVKKPEHSLQSLWPGLTQSVIQTQNATCWGPCQLQFWVWRWMWVQEWPLIQSSSASAMLYSHKTFPACRIPVILDRVYQLPVLCVYLPGWLWSRRFAVGGTSGNTTKLHLWWRVQSLFQPIACYLQECKSVLEYSVLYKAQQLKDS